MYDTDQDYDHECPDDIYEGGFTNKQFDEYAIPSDATTVNGVNETKGSAQVPSNSSGGLSK